MPNQLLNQPVKVDKQLAIALLLRALHFDIVDMIEVDAKIHQTLRQIQMSTAQLGGAILRPRMSYHSSSRVLHQILEPCGKPYCFMEATIQGARTEARKLIFGDADDNVGYAHFVKEDLKKAGHYVSLSFTSRKATMQNLDKIIIVDKVLHWKNTKLDGLPPNERKEFVVKWYEDHENQIFPQLGSPTNHHRLQFLNRIFFASSFVKRTVPHLQKVFMADICHLHFGK